MNGAFETEHKYLIRMPSIMMLEGQAGCVRWDIRQTYLISDSGITERVRCVEQEGRIRFFHTVKRRISVLTSDEAEREISKEEYDGLLDRADPQRKPVLKTRFRIPWLGQMLEIDLYPFWHDRAILEIEVEDEAQAVQLPPWLSVIREVTVDVRYKNARLAAEVPMDPIE